MRTGPVPFSRRAGGGAEGALASGWGLRGERGYKPDNAGQHTRLAYAQAGGIVFEPFFISNDKDLALFKRKKWPICRAIADAIAAEVSA